MKCVKFAREKGVKVVGLVGFDGGELKPMCDQCVVADICPSAFQVEISASNKKPAKKKSSKKKTAIRKKAVRKVPRKKTS